MQLISIWILLFFVVLGVSNPTYAKKLVADSNWVSGSLENGFKYHIYPTDDAEVSIRLVIHAGSLQENEQQKGYAHFVEHMAFNGSRNFVGNDIIKIIEQSGKQFGPDINAFTAYQATVYHLDLASKAQLDTGLTWMRDVADGINFDGQQVEKEKGAILGEFRFSRPENQDFYTKAYLHLISGSVLADADPLGSEQSVQQATVAGLKGYYQKWYQPQNAELIVVGDVNEAALAQQLQQQFSNWVSNGDSPTRKQRKFHYNLEPNVFTIGDNQSPRLFYIIDRNASDGITMQEQLHQLWLDEVSQALIRQRLAAAFSESAVPVQKVNTFTQWIHHDRFSAGEVVFAPQQRATVETLFLATLRSLRDFGVTQNELESVLVDYQTTLTNLDATWQAHKPSHYANNKMLELGSGQIVQDKFNHAKTLQKFIDYANLKRVNRNLDALLSSDVTWVMGKAASEEQSLVEARLAQLPAVYAKQGAKPVESDKVIEEFLQPSQSGKILSRVDREANFTVWQLSNGLEVWFQQDSQAGKRAYIQYASQGGKAALPKELYAASQLLVDTAVRSGLGEFNGAKLDRFLRKQGVSIFPYINLTQHGLEANSAVDALPVAFNVIYNIVTELNLAARQLEAVKQQVFQDNRVFLESPQGQFERAINNNTYLPNSRHRFISNGELASVTVEQLQQVHDSLFRFERNHKLVIVADIEPEQLAPLLVKYIAPIAFKLQPKNAVNLRNGYNLNPKPELEVAAFNEDSVVVLKRIINTSPQPRAAKDVFAEDMLSKISNMRLNQLIREDGGLDYAPEMSLVIQDGESASDWMIYSHVTRQDVPVVQQQLNKLLDGLSASITQQELDTAAKQLISGLKPLEQDPFQRSWFYSRYLIHGYGIEALLDVEQTVQSIDLEYIQQRAKWAFGDNAKQMDATLTPAKLISAQ